MSMRILHCIASMGGGGAERHVAYLCRGLAQLDWDVTVALLDPGPNMEWLEGTGVRIEFLKHKTNYDLRIVWQLVSLIKRLRPDIVHTWLTMMNTAGGIAAGLTGTAFLGGEQNSTRAYSGGWKDRLQNLVLSSWATAVTANSGAGLEYLQTHLKDDVAKFVVPNGIPIADIDVLLPASRQAMTVGRDAEVILYVGRFEAQKNLPALFQALPSVFQARPRTVAILCGTGSLRQHWIDWVRQHDLEHKILFPGYVNDVWSWMKSSDVFVLPSLFEGQPNVVLEAMACRCPLVVSDIREHREFLEDDCALLVPPDSAERTAEAIVDTLADRRSTAIRVENARKRVSQHTVEEMVKSYQDIYLQLTEAGHARP